MSTPLIALHNIEKAFAQEPDVRATTDYGRYRGGRLRVHHGPVRGGEVDLVAHPRDARRRMDR